MHSLLMPSHEWTLNLRCPNCHHDEARLFVSTPTLLTVICASCQSAWSATLSGVPDSVRDASQRLATVGERRV